LNQIIVSTVLNFFQENDHTNSFFSQKVPPLGIAPLVRALLTNATQKIPRTAQKNPQICDGAAQNKSALINAINTVESNDLQNITKTVHF